MISLQTCKVDFVSYSLCPKIIGLTLGYFCTKTIVRLTCPARNFEAQSQIFSRQGLVIKKSFDTATSGGISE